MCVLCKEEGGSNGEDNGQEMTQYENNTSKGSSGERDEQETIQHENDPTSGGVVVGQVLEHHQIGISSTGELIVRKLQFTRIFHIS